MEASSHQAITKKRSVWPLMPICLPIICLAVYYTPFLVSLGWHLTHGMAANYRGLRIPVPFGWTVDTGSSEDFPANPQGIILEKQSETLHLESRGPETMFFNRLLPDAQSTPTQQAANWENLFLQSHSSSDYDMSRRNDLSADIDCLQATPVDARSATALACISSKNGWVAIYAGTPANVPVFLRVANTVKAKP